MVTTVTQQTRATADKEIERLKKENEQLRKGVLEIRQGQIFRAKDGIMHIKLLEVNPKTEFPVKSGGTWKDTNGKEHPEYKVGKWLFVKEEELLAVGAGERAFANIYFNRRS